MRISTDNDYVILLHGFLRTRRSMKKLERTLLKKGYRVINLNYPSTKEPIESLAESYLKKCVEKECTDSTKKIHFVTHSMGAIIVRYFLVKHKFANLGKVVMLAPPNHGSKFANFFGRFKITHLLLGPALKQLQTDKTSLPNILPLPQYEFGIIAGKYDKKVPLESAKLPYMQDFLLVPNTHSFIMNSKKVIKAVQNFLENGKF